MQQLSPRSPPGNAKRKARAYEGEIKRLRSQGYSMESIREALGDVGVTVSKSTVQREAARPATTVATPAAGSAAPATREDRPAGRPGGTGGVDSTLAPAVSNQTGRTGAPQGAARGRDALSGKDAAEAFVNQRVGKPPNPLLKLTKRGSS